jgi:hypothetical protein
VKLTAKWSQLPPEVRAHLSQRFKGSQRHNGRFVQNYSFGLNPVLIYRMENGTKDFGTFKMAGRGPLVLTFLSHEQVPWGTEIADVDIED